MDFPASRARQSAPSSESTAPSMTFTSWRRGLQGSNHGGANLRDVFEHASCVGGFDFALPPDSFILRATRATCSASSTPARSSTAAASSSPASAQRATMGASAGRSGAGTCVAPSRRSRREISRPTSSPISVRRVVGTPRSLAQKPARRASCPIQKPEPSSPRAGPHPPARYIAPSAARPRTLEPVPAMMRIPGPPRKAPSRAISSSPASRRLPPTYLLISILGPFADRLDGEACKADAGLGDLAEADACGERDLRQHRLQPGGGLGFADSHQLDTACGGAPEDPGFVSQETSCLSTACIDRQKETHDPT